MSVVIHTCYEWLITYIVQETYNKQQSLVSTGKCRTEARNESQVYWASVLTRIYGEYNAFKFYCSQLATTQGSMHTVLEQLGILYGVSNLEKHCSYFYQGRFARTPEFSLLLKEGVLRACAGLKDNVVAIVDALAPPDYVINSVLGKTDGKVCCDYTGRTQSHSLFQLYENLQATFLQNPKALTRPEWWQEIVVPGAPDFKKPKCKL